MFQFLLRLQKDNFYCSWCCFFFIVLTANSCERLTAYSSVVPRAPNSNQISQIAHLSVHIFKFNILVNVCMNEVQLNNVKTRKKCFDLLFFQFQYFLSNLIDSIIVLLCCNIIFPFNNEIFRPKHYNFIYYVNICFDFLFQFYNFMNLIKIFNNKMFTILP